MQRSPPELLPTSQHASYVGPVWAHPNSNGARPASHLCMLQRCKWTELVIVATWVVVFLL